MERTLIEAWEQIEAKELLLEKKKPAKVSAIKTSPKGKVTAVKGKKLDEDGVGGPAGAGIGSASNTAAKGDTFTKSGSAAVVPTKLGKKAIGEKANKYPNRNEKFKKVQEVDQNLKNAASQAAQSAVSNVKAGKGTSADATLVGQVAEEELPEAPGPEVPEDIAADLGGEEGGDPHADGPEAAAAMDQGAEEEAEDVSVDAETAEQVVNAIMQQYPGAIITISVQLPDDTPFDTDLVAAAQEVATGATGEDPALAAPAAPESNPELDGVPAEDPEKDAAEAMMEKRKLIISKTRKQIKEMFAAEGLGDEEPAAPEVGAEDPAADPALDGEMDPAADPAAALGDVGGVQPEVEVGDSKIALTPEQWGQVLATTDLLNGGGAGEEAGSEIDLPAEGGEGGEEVPAEEPVVDGGDEEQLEELKTEVDIDSEEGKVQILKKVQKSDFAKDKKTDVAIKREGKMNESFNAELAGYAQALQKLISE
jgi:hypothetical protein